MMERMIGFALGTAVALISLAGAQELRSEERTPRAQPSTSPSSNPTPIPSATPVADCKFSSDEKGLPGDCTANLTACPLVFIIGPLPTGPAPCNPEMRISCEGQTLSDGPWVAYQNGTLNPRVAQGVASSSDLAPPSIFITLPPDSTQHASAQLNLPDIGTLGGSCLLYSQAARTR